MTYESDHEAQEEAARYPVRADEVVRLQGLCAQNANEFGSEGVRGHLVKFPVTAWEKVTDALPDGVPGTGRITRGDVFAIADDMRAGNRDATDLFTASFIWGWGPTGFGPRRYSDICAAAGDRLEPALHKALSQISKNPRSPDPIAGYAQFYGGWDYDVRAQAGDARWARLHKYGPAFFTKFLYFSTPGTLILDNRLANAVHKLSGLPKLVTKQGRSLPWTPYRYAVYLHWMRQTADALSTAPEMLEATLFQPPADPLAEHDAAD
jgi:hypothetical protein